MAWGATVPMIAHAVGIEPGNVAAIRFTINGVYDGREVISLDAAGPRGRHHPLSLHGIWKYPCGSDAGRVGGRPDAVAPGAG